MKKEELLDLITELKVDDRFIEEAMVDDLDGRNPVKAYAASTKRSPMRIIAPVAACLAVIAGAGFVLKNMGSPNVAPITPASEGSASESDETSSAESIDNGSKPNTVSTDALPVDTIIPTDTSLSLWEVPLTLDLTFTLPDFEGFEFKVDANLEHPMFNFNWGKNGSLGSGNNVNNVYFSDLDGDGQREIILNTPFVGDGCVRVYGFMDNGEMGKAVYFENGGCQLVESNGILNYKAKNSGERKFEFSRSDLKPIFMQGYSCELLDWDHTLDYSEIMFDETFKLFNITITNRTLKIDCKGELLFDPEHKLGELYTLPDVENHSLIFVFTNEDNGKVGALKFTLSNPGQSFVLYYFEENITLKPAADKLLIVHEDGTEEPFEFPAE